MPQQALIIGLEGKLDLPITIGIDRIREGSVSIENSGIRTINRNDGNW